MKFHLVIDLGNDAMRSPADVMAAVTRGFSPLDPESPSLFAPMEGGQEARLFDANGNSVGCWKVTT